MVAWSSRSRLAAGAFLWFLGVHSLQRADAATEFVCKIRASGGDYTSLSAWENAVSCNLTATTTSVFGHSGIQGGIPDGSSVTGETSGATGTCRHAGPDQVLISGLVGAFQSGEQVYETLDTDYVVLSDAGASAVAVAECYDDWPAGLDDNLVIDGWTTDATNHVKVTVAPGHRHAGVAPFGFTTGLKIDTTGLAHVVTVKADYTVIEWLESRAGRISPRRRTTASKASTWRPIKRSSSAS